MDLESELGVSESVGDDDDGQVVAKKPENFVSNDDAVVERNGGYGVDGGRVEEGVKGDKGEVSSSSPQVMKGYGLKKWRRIRRESGGLKEGGGSGDAGKIGKRGLPNTSQQNLRNAVVGGCDDVKQRSEGSVSSTNAVVKSRGLGDDGFYAGVGGGAVFVAGVEDSGNSEDRSSKSSTAAARALRSRHEGTAVGEDARMKNLNGNVSGNMGVLPGQQGKNRTGSSKKARGEQVKIEKENSHSSMESDSRSSNFVYMQVANSVTSNGRQSRSANYDGENSDEAQGGELGEELQAGFQKNLAEFEDVSQDYLAAELTWERKGESSENYGSSADRDPLVESIITLQFAQEALEKELEELRKIGKDDILLFSGLVQESGLPSKFASADSGVHEPSSSSPLQYGESNLLESQIIGLKQNVDYLERKLEEASSMLQTKEAKITELESTLNNNNMSQCEETYSVELKQVKYQEMETQLESIYKQKIEAEIVYLAISRTIQALRVAAVDQITILEEQKDLASEQAEILNKLEDTGNKTSMLKKQAEKLETYCEEIVETDEILKLQKRVCQYSSCFFIQLVLLCVVLGLFILQLAPHYNGVVPT